MAVSSIPYHFNAIVSQTLGGKPCIQLKQTAAENGECITLFGQRTSTPTHLKRCIGMIKYPCKSRTERFRCWLTQSRNGFSENLGVARYRGRDKGLS
jgi:hypothetical protein